MRKLDPRWRQRREAMQARYAELSGLPDASRLAYLHGPARRWTGDEVSEMWARAIGEPASDVPTLNNVYLHVPFCKSVCSFCNYERIKPSAPGLLEAYTRRVVDSLETLAPVVRPLSFHAFYIGGGTPSVLPPRLLEPLLEAFDRLLTWADGASRHIEFDPQVMNPAKLRVLQRHGFEYFSFGIETLDVSVNQLHNRGRQDRAVVEARFEDFREAEIDNLACDFLVGLKGTSPEQVLEEIEEVVATHRPARVDIYMLTPTEAYLESHFGGDREAFWHHMGPFEAQVPPGLEALSGRTGYVLAGGQGHHLQLHRPEHERARLRARHSYTTLVHQAKRPLHVLGFGPSARSQIFGQASFEARDPAHESDQADGRTWYRGHAIDLAGECRSYLVHALRDQDAVDRDAFRAAFGHDIEAVFPVAVAAWGERGDARLEADALRFRPMTRRERTAALLWLVPDDALEFEVARRQGLDLSEEGLDHLVRLSPDTALAAPFRYAGRERQRLIVRSDRGSHQLRIAPDLDPSKRLRLVLEGSLPQEEQRAPLKRSIAVLTKLLRSWHSPAVRADRPRSPAPAAPDR
ncbi:MAG: radical SAM protein [Deltaproteobacteria bacterium]|nr:radical SAM protein [Deltaproteobacteria bacterium]